MPETPNVIHEIASYPESGPSMQNRAIEPSPQPVELAAAELAAVELSTPGQPAAVEDIGKGKKKVLGSFRHHP
jgi:hypothetical protein